MIDTEVCKVDDDFIRDKLRWILVLNNGERIYQDDDRVGLEPCAWKRVKQYCFSNDLYVKEMYFQFRSHIVLVGGGDPTPQGFFFCKSAMAIWGSENTYHGYIGGMVLDNQHMSYVHYLTPSLVLLDSGIRKIIEGQEECVIDNRSSVSYITR